MYIPLSPGAMQKPPCETQHHVYDPKLASKAYTDNIFESAIQITTYEDYKIKVLYSPTWRRLGHEWDSVYQIKSGWQCRRPLCSAYQTCSFK